jgi:hypothetical protein
MKPWDAYQPGDQEALEHGVRILGLDKKHSSQRLTSYSVVFVCCDFETTLTHERIRKRISGGQRRCRECGKRRRARRDEVPAELHLPLWPVPGYQQRQTK